VSAFECSIVFCRKSASIFDATLTFRYSHEQGDLIWRMFAYWAIVYFGRFFLKITELLKVLGYFFPPKWVGLHFGRFFSQAPLVALVMMESSVDIQPVTLN
jgi:hypothetical protein